MREKTGTLPAKYATEYMRKALLSTPDRIVREVGRALADKLMKGGLFA